jgi:O-antigen/teichoic acid export membrane protein
VVAFWPSAAQVIRLLYGERFVQAAPAARLLVVGAALMALVILGIFLLTAAEKQRRYPAVALFGLALNVGLNLLLIPRLSYYGSAIATVITWAVTVVLLWVVVARSMPVRGLLPLRDLASLAVVIAAVACVGYYLVQWRPAWWPVVSASAVVAFIGLAMLFGLTTGIGVRRSAPQ